MAKKNRARKYIVCYNSYMDCYFFGTFNPIHLGHIKIAEEIKKQFSFDKIIFVPSYTPPHKNSIDYFHRLNMLKLCNVQISEIEKDIEPPNYTYKTIEKLGKVCFIIGYDAFFELETWKKPEYLKKMLKFIVVPRDKKYEKNEFEKMKNLGYDFVIADFVPVDISSKEIRLKVKNSQSIKNLVTKEVEGYIYEHHLY